MAAENSFQKLIPMARAVTYYFFNQDSVHMANILEKKVNQSQTQSEMFGIQML